jgi:hypothetical protein
MVARVLADERSITGAFGNSLRAEFNSIARPTFAFHARVLTLREERDTAADMAVVLRTPAGTKWLLLQAKYGPRVAHEWRHLIDEQCPRILAHGPGRALVYYDDEFVIADARRVADGAAPRPRSGRRINVVPSPHWFAADRGMSFFFNCWGGSRRHFPAVLPALTVLIVSSAPTTGIARDLTGGLSEYLSELHEEAPPERGQ